MREEEGGTHGAWSGGQIRARQRERERAPALLSTPPGSREAGVHRV